MIRRPAFLLIKMPIRCSAFHRLSSCLLYILVLYLIAETLSWRQCYDSNRQRRPPLAPKQTKAGEEEAEQSSASLELLIIAIRTRARRLFSPGPTIIDNRIKYHRATILPIEGGAPLIAFSAVGHHPSVIDLHICN